MNDEEANLTVDEGRNRVLAALADRWPGVSFRVPDRETLVRRFGWVFMLEVAPLDETSSLASDLAIPRLALVNKRSGQAVVTSRPYTPEQFAEVFERLTARSRVNARNWCLTMHAHLDVADAPTGIAEAARRAGLEELAGSLENGSF